MMHWLIIVIYALAMIFILAYSLNQLYLILAYKKADRKPTKELDISDQLPMLTVQLPVYNERYVIERLLDAVVEMDYPKDKLEIQLLDDSTDESKSIAEKKIAQLRKAGKSIHHLHRKDRKGFKAGALAAGLAVAKGDLIAIFDADFIPPKDFLLRMVGAFQDEKVGMVQSRWGHLNKDYSLLTRLQAFGLDAHFSVEQKGRNSGQHFMNFNGTAGIWRKKTIIDAGGWQDDTLTEDLDLSYRAQLKGWKFIFKEEVEAPAELPAEINALKNQQYRWNKGAAECLRKNLMKVLSKKEIPLSTKINAVFHLMNSAIFLSVITIACLSIPMVWIKDQHPELTLLFKAGLIFLICLPVLIFFYWTSEKTNNKNFRPIRFFYDFLRFLAVSMGLSLHNAMAVAEGYLGKKTPFVRTPKFNLTSGKQSSWKQNIYLNRSLNPMVFLEAILSIYFFSGIYLAFKYDDFGLLPFHLILGCGFAYIVYITINHSLKYRG